MISKKRSQRINDKNMQRVIDRIYDDLNELIDAQGIGCYGTTSKQFKLTDYQLDDKDNFIVKTEDRTY